MREWITGRNPVYEALRARRRQFFRLVVAQGIEPRGHVQEILQMAKERRLAVEQAQRARLNNLGENHQGVALEVSGYPYKSLADVKDLARSRGEDLFVLALDVIQNPQNLGTLLRTAEAIGVHGVLIPPHNAAGITPAVVTASAGASEHMLVVPGNLVQSITELKDAGAWVVGLEAAEEAQLPQALNLKGSLVVVVGSEGEGMRALVRKSCDFLMRLPMQGHVDSLNAAVAGSIALYLAYLQRQAG